eukprot:Em1208g1a
MTAAATGWSAPSLLAQNAQLQSGAQSHMDSFAPLSPRAAALAALPATRRQSGTVLIQTDALQYYDQADQLATRRKRRFACTCPNCQNGQKRQVKQRRGAVQEATRLSLLEMRKDLRENVGSACSPLLAHGDHLSKHVEIHQKVTKERGDGLLRTALRKVWPRKGTSAVRMNAAVPPAKLHRAKTMRDLLMSLSDSSWI